MSLEKPTVSIYTCVYNMADKIHRALDSIKKIDYPNLEHVIVNDGSTDNVEELIKSYIDEVNYPVKYIKKENGGKHTALNVAWDNATGEFMLQCDADDALLPNSVAVLVEAWFSIPEKVRDRYWSVNGHCVTQNGEFVGDKYPEGINQKSWEEQKEIAKKVRGEKIGLIRRDYMIPYRFPVPKGIKMIAESCIWTSIRKKYMTWYTNEVVRVYYVNEGNNLSARPTTRQAFSNKAFTKKFYYQQYGGIKNIIQYGIAYPLSTQYYKENNRFFEGFKFLDKLILICLFPFCWLLKCLYVKKNNLKLTN